MDKPSADTLAALPLTETLRSLVEDGPAVGALPRVVRGLGAGASSAWPDVGSGTFATMSFKKSKIGVVSTVCLLASPRVYEF